MTEGVDLAAIARCVHDGLGLSTRQVESLLAYIVQLQQERARLQEALMASNPPQCSWPEGDCQLGTEACPYCTLVNELEAQVATLRAALAEVVRLGAHSMLCGGWLDRKCECYLSTARAALAEVSDD